MTRQFAAVAAIIARAAAGIDTPFGNHHPSFTEYSNRPQNHAVARKVGTAMAQTIIDALTDEKLVASAKAEFDLVHSGTSSSKVVDAAL